MGPQKEHVMKRLYNLVGNILSILVLMVDIVERAYIIT